LEELLSKHLDEVAMCMGRFLRGFDDPAIHLGTASSFVAEFRKIMGIQILRQPGERQMASYASATSMYRVCPIHPLGTESSDPVSTMIHGLTAPAPAAPDLRRKLPLETLHEDISALLHTPAMHFYLKLRDRGGFFSALEQISRTGGFPLVLQDISSKADRILCPLCRAPLSAVRPGQILKCESCSQALESVRALPMVPAAVAAVSYEMLREMLDLQQVEGYQEEGKIVPLDKGSECRE
jgi:hypothetical protein